MGLPADTPLIQVISEDPATQQQLSKGASPMKQARCVGTARWLCACIGD